MKPSEGRLRRGAVGAGVQLRRRQPEAGRARGAGHVAHLSRLLHRPPSAERHQQTLRSSLRKGDLRGPDMRGLLAEGSRQDSRGQDLNQGGTSR